MYKRGIGLTQLGEQIKGKFDPISRCNLVIEQYNDAVNREGEVFLKTAHNDFLYKLWFALESRCLFCMLVCYFIPFINLLTFIGNCFTLLIHEFAVCILKSNQKRIPDPFMYMVYSPILCNRGSTSYLYFEIASEQLESFKFDPEIMTMLRERRSYDNKIRFMVYNNEFLAGYHNMLKARFIPLIHVILNGMIFFVMQYFVYEPFLCLSLLAPIDSLTECSF